MEKLIPQVERYLHDTLGVSVAPKPCSEGSRVPFFLQDRYSFFVAHLLDLPCLLMVENKEKEEPPATIRKHIDQVRTKWNGPVIYVHERVTAYNRRRLIEQKVPFIIPGNQMYLPMLAIHLREHFRKPKTGRPKFRPSTQAILIHTLLHGIDELSPTELAPRLGYSAMTISRALDELEAADLAESAQFGRERHLHFTEPRPWVWKKAQPFLRNPVQGRHWIRMVQRHELPGPLAGLSALAHYSMLAEPHYVVVAVSREDWKSLRQRDAATEAGADEPDALNVEVWSYPPALLADTRLVDRLSLYLSLKDTKDERIEVALDEMMENVTW
ncbi:MAG: winged helix-turn-helix domain-containing protein [Pirellulales bacterium]